MRALIHRWPFASAFVGLMASMFVLPLFYNGMPGGFWALLPFMYFVPGAVRALWQDIKHGKRWVHARTARAKVSDEALTAFLAERTDERQ